MKLKLIRQQPTKKSTTGSLYIDGVFECYTIEDIERTVKKYGETAIPKGTYKIVRTMSTRFKKVLPLLLNVPGFAGIRMHPGNKPEDTEGCILPGTTRATDFVGNSRIAFKKLDKKIEDALTKGETVTIEIL